MNCDGLRWHDIYIPVFMKIGRGFQAILRFGLRNSRGCNVCITDGRDLLMTPSHGLRFHDIHTKFHKDWFWHSKVNGGG
jgi:hypothetical protein